MGFVVCASCGTQIKAGRTHCLRCGEELPAEDAPIRIPLSESLGLSQRNLILLVSGASVIAIALVVVILRTRPVVIDEDAQPVVRPAAVAQTTPAPATADGAPDGADQPAPQSTPAVVPAVRAAAMDATRTGGAAFATGNFEAARVAYEEALAKHPDDADTLNNLGLTLVRLGKPSDALPRFERAVALAPEKAAFHFNLGHAAGELRQWDRAIEQYRVAVGLFPADYATQYNLAMALHKKGDDKSAVPEFEKAIALAPGEGSFHLSLGVSLEQVGRVGDAVREYRTYLEMVPAAPEAAALKAHLDAITPARVARQ